MSNVAGEGEEQSIIWTMVMVVTIPTDFFLNGAMMLAMVAALPTADFGLYNLFRSCHALRPDPGKACSTRRTSVPNSPVIVVTKHDANALLSAVTFPEIASRFVTL